MSELKLFKTIIVIDDENLFPDYIVAKDLDAAYDQVQDTPGTYITEISAEEEFKELRHLLNRLHKCQEDINASKYMNLQIILPLTKSKD